MAIGDYGSSSRGSWNSLYIRFFVPIRHDIFSKDADMQAGIPIRKLICEANGTAGQRLGHEIFNLQSRSTICTYLMKSSVDGKSRNRYAAVHLSGRYAAMIRRNMPSRRNLLNAYR